MHGKVQRIAINSNFQIPISLQSDGVTLKYFDLKFTTLDFLDLGIRKFVEFVHDKDSIS